jgi:hypothetical protein
METEVRPLRGCELCGGVDTDPRHVVDTPKGEAGVPDAEMLKKMIDGGIGDEMLNEIMQDDTQVRHMDCCAAAGCPAEDGAKCEAPERAGSGLTRDELLAHIKGGAE